MIFKKDSAKLNEWMGIRIAQLRLSMGISQNQFALQLGVTRMSLINMENGAHTINNRDIYNIAKLCNVTVLDLFPQQDKKGNLISYDEYEELGKTNPNDYPPITPDYVVKSLEEIGQLKQDRAKIKASKELLNKMGVKISKKDKVTGSGSIVRQLS